MRMTSNLMYTNYVITTLTESQNTVQANEMSLTCAASACIIHIPRYIGRKNDKAKQELLASLISLLVFF